MEAYDFAELQATGVGLLSQDAEQHEGHAATRKFTTSTVAKQTTSIVAQM
jgi:hypothetical protein